MHDNKDKKQFSVFMNSCSLKFHGFINYKWYIQFCSVLLILHTHFSFSPEFMSKMMTTVFIPDQLIIILISVEPGSFSITDHIVFLDRLPNSTGSEGTGWINPIKSEWSIGCEWSFNADLCQWRIHACSGNHWKWCKKVRDIICLYKGYF